GAVVLVAAGVGAGIALTSDDSGQPAATPPSAHSSAAPTTSAKINRVVPAQVLPTDQQVQQTTLLNLSKHGDVDTGVYPDQKTDPPECSLANGPIGTTTVGSAISVAAQMYADLPGDDYHNSAYAFAGVFNSDADAAAAIPKVTGVVQKCKGFSASDGRPGSQVLHWTVSDVKSSQIQISWKDTQQGDAPWACSWVTRVQTNVLVAAMVCDHNPGDSGPALADVVVDNIPNQK
ncbi:MAG: sensor domain-containing protein, partial [Mycobacterium sp.]|nr:sensor domain-containing protein [Mycobacterium sp.]